MSLPIEKLLQPTGNLRVMAQRCEQCLMSRNALVAPERRRDILAECRSDNLMFVCHEAAEDKGYAVCRGFYDAGHLLGSGAVKLAVRFGWVEFVSSSGEIASNSEDLVAEAE